MQRYRINYNWLIGTFVGAFLLAVTSYFVWSWQVERKAGSFISKAEEALASGDTHEAFRYFFRYVQLRPDEEEARIKMAKCAVEVMNSKDPEIRIESKQHAYRVLTQTIRKTDNSDLRFELAKITNAQEAISIVDDLLAKNPEDPEMKSELASMKIRSLFAASKFDQLKRDGFEFIGYDSKADEFDLSKVAIQGEPEVYVLISQALLRDKEEDLARRVIDHMVEANPDSAEAYLHKSNFLAGQKEYDESKEFLDKAYEIDPKNDKILTRQTLASLMNPKYASAKMDFLEAITKFEESAKEISSKSAASPAYKEAKQNLEEALADFEASRPNYEEAKANFESTRASYAEAVNTLADAITSDMGRAPQLDQDTFVEAKTALQEKSSAYESVLPEPELAIEFAQKGLQEHPDNVVFYRLVGQAQQSLGRTEEALKTVDKGINKFSKSKNIELVLYKIDLLLPQKDYDAIDDEIERLKKINLFRLQPIIDFQNARVEYAKQNWSAASKQLSQVHSELHDFPRYQTMARTMLGVSYERQGIPDLAKNAYELVLQEYPEHAAALQGRNRALARMGKTEGDGVELDDIVNKTLELAEDAQDWDKVEELVLEVSEKNELSPAAVKLLRAKILIKRGRYSQAKSLIREAAKDENLTEQDMLNIRYSAILLVLNDPNQGAPEALKLLDGIEKRWGKSLRSLMQRADLLVRLNPEDVSEQLRGLEAEAESLTGENAIDENGMLRLYEVIATQFERLARYEDAREYYSKLIEALPTSLPLRMRLFDISLREGNLQAMESAQEKVLEYVGSKTDPSYVLTQVRSQVLRFGRREIEREELAKSREQLDLALESRPKWHELHITYGQLLLLIGEDIQLVLQHFDDALDAGPARAGVVSVQVKLLAERGLYKQALDRMKLLRKEIRSQLLGRTEADILIKTGDINSGFESAKKLAASQPNNPATQQWFSRIAQQAGQLDESIPSLRAALKINPSDPDSWIRLVGLHIELKRFDEVENIVREAHLACDPEILPMLTGKFMELTSRWQEAEKIYLASYEGQYDNIAVARRLADFYLLWSKKDDANLGKAAVYINRILRAANEGRAEANNPTVIWARQKAAAILYAEQDYQKSLKAERLLRQSAVNDSMNTEEASLLADILISRNDPKSLLQAKEILTKLLSEGRLPKKGGTQLATILSKTGEWKQAESLLRSLVRDNSEDSSIRMTQINLLIEHGEYKRAQQAIERLEKIDPKNSAIIQLKAQLASESGDQAGLVRMLNGLVPKRTSMNAQQLQMMFNVAQIADRFGAYELAGELYTTSARFDPSKNLALATFHVHHGDCDKAVELMKRLLDDEMDRVVRLANRLIKVRREEHGDKYDQVADQMINYALRDDPDSVTRQMARAEAYETQGKNKESIATYDKILSRTDLTTTFRALAMNNLGFQLGLLEQRVDEAEQLVNEAIETFGPVEDMLDTRAVVRIAQQKYDLAIEDMTLALSVSQDPVKYFHLAKAYILAGDGQAALKAWEQAKKFGFEKDALPILEKPAFDQILQKIESFNSQSAKL